MKKIYLSIGTLLLCSNMMMAQTNRTAKTTVIDVLAQMPADKQADYNKLIGDLSTTGAEGVNQLVQMLAQPTQEASVNVKYALSGLTHFVRGAGQESARATVAKAYANALSQLTDREAKAFVIRQLQLIAEDESVATLAQYLTDESLCGPAARALAAIDSDLSDDTLLQALNGSNGACKKDIVAAIAASEVEGAEAALLAIVESSDVDLQKETLYALSRCGSKTSAKTLASKAAKANYTMEPTGANEAYISLIKRMLEQGDVKNAEKEAKSLWKKARKANQTHSRNAALEIILSIQKGEGMDLVLDALKDKDMRYRNAALVYAADFIDVEGYKEIVKRLEKSSPEAKVDILNWLGTQANCAKVEQLLRNTEVRLDVPIMQVLQAQVANENFAVAQAATWALVRIADKASIPTIVELLNSTDVALVSLAEQALASFSGDITPDVARIVDSASPVGKVAAMNLLSLRKASNYANKVYELLNASDSEVKQAAYAALKNVVSDKDLTRLFGMLQEASVADVSPIQQAIISALSKQTADQKVKTIVDQMYRAGDAKKYLYYKLLASTGDAQALEQIAKGFASSTGAAKDAAFEAILTFKGAGAAEQLFVIAQNPSFASYFDRALNTYVTMIGQAKMTGENKLIFLRNAMEIAKTAQQKTAILKRIERTGTFLGLIYAGNFIEDSALQQAAAMAVMNIALAHPEYNGTAVRTLLKRVAEVNKHADAEYHRKGIQKHLDEMPAGDGYVALFNGKDLTGWKGLVKNPIARAKMSRSELATAQAKVDAVAKETWLAQDGSLVFTGKGNNLCTDKQYGDFEMYVDWMLDPAGPEADAGIYLRGTPQVQMWDTSRVKVGAQVGSGGLYNNQKNPSKPLKVADNKLGEWNSMYIKMIGERVTVVLNGELVVDNVILENYWDRKNPIFPQEQIELQAHGSKVSYRNIYVKELEQVKPFELSADEKKEGFKVLFDGTSLNEWVGNKTSYITEKGCIVMYPEKRHGGNLYTKDEYGNFVYRFDFKLTAGANNGLGIRTPMDVDAAYAGMELQILDNDSPIYKDIAEYQFHGSVYGIIAAKKGALNPVGEWNTQEVIADGNHIKVTLNGKVIIDGDIKEASKNGTADKKKHPGLFNEKGHIGFLGHGSEVRFRNVRIKELK